MKERERERGNEREKKKEKKLFTCVTLRNRVKEGERKSTFLACAGTLAPLPRQREGERGKERERAREISIPVNIEGSREKGTAPCMRRNTS